MYAKRMYDPAKLIDERSSSNSFIAVSAWISSQKGLEERVHIFSDLEIEQETGKAVLLKVSDDRNPKWFPKSQINYGTLNRLEKGEGHTYPVPGYAHIAKFKSGGYEPMSSSPSVTKSE